MNESILDSENFLGIYNLYPEMEEIAVVSSCTKNEEGEAIEEYFRPQGIKVYTDEGVTIDEGQGVGYSRASDYILLDGEICGRHGFEEEEYTFDSSLTELFTNNPDMALPEWFKEEWIEAQGFAKGSCEFNVGMYKHSRQDDPREIIQQANDKGFDIIFQIDYCNPFEIGFCVWKKEH